MLLIGENVHIISKSVRTALEEHDENFVKNLAKIMQNCDAVDLNVGPAKGKLDNIFQWLIPIFQDISLSFDSSNIDAIKNGLRFVCHPEKSFINSTSADDEKLEILTDLAFEYNCNIIALAMSKQTGIPKNSDSRMELIFKMYEKSVEKAIDSSKLFFDPLILPVNVDQVQAFEVLNTIRMIKESFEPKVKTLVGLSNISNGLPVEIRPLVNRVYGVMLFGAGLDSAIIDANDTELVRIFRMLECNNPQKDIDKLYLNISSMVQCFGNVEDVVYDKSDKIQANIIKTLKILMNREVFSNSYAEL